MEVMTEHIEDIAVKKARLSNLVLDVMSHYGYPVGEVKISYNCFSSKTVIRVQRSEKLEGRTITISETL